MSTENIQKELADLETQLENFNDDVTSMLDHAREQNDEVYNESPGHVHIDYLPFGEEVTRTKHIPEIIEEIQEELNQADPENIKETTKLIEESQERMDEMKDLFEECFSQREIEQAKENENDYPY